MGSVLLVIYLMVIILLVVLILAQRNSGNALSGLGGGNGADSFLSARGKGNLLTRTTAVLATLMFILALALDLYYKGDSKKVESVTDIAPLSQAEPATPAVPNATTAEATPAESNPAPVASEAEAATEAETPDVPAATEPEVETPDVPATVEPETEPASSEASEPQVEEATAE